MARRSTRKPCPRRRRSTASGTSASSTTITTTPATSTSPATASPPKRDTSPPPPAPNFGTRLRAALAQIDAHAAVVMNDLAVHGHDVTTLMGAAIRECDRDSRPLRRSGREAAAEEVAEKNKVRETYWLGGYEWYAKHEEPVVDAAQKEAMRKWASKGA